MPAPTAAPSTGERVLDSDAVMDIEVHSRERHRVDQRVRLGRLVVRRGVDPVRLEETVLAGSVQAGANATFGAARNDGLLDVHDALEHRDHLRRRLDVGRQLGDDSDLLLLDEDFQLRPDFLTFDDFLHLRVEGEAVLSRELDDHLPEGEADEPLHQRFGREVLACVHALGGERGVDDAAAGFERRLFCHAERVVVVEHDVEHPHQGALLLGGEATATDRVTGRVGGLGHSHNSFRFCPGLFEAGLFV